jgi:RNA recognition motif-containing protein
VVITTKHYRDQIGKDGSSAGRQVYVGNLPFHTSWKDLKDAFSSSGAIVRAEVLTTMDGKPKGAGTVLFESSADANRA